MSDGVSMSQVVTRNGVLAFEQSGSPDGDAVVLLHGFPDVPGTWDAVLAQLPADHRYIRPSLRGVAGSTVDPDARSGQVAALAADVLDLIDALHLRDIVLVGHDWGARAAHAVAATAPDLLRGLVTIATAYGSREGLGGQESLDDAAVAWYRYWLCSPIGEAAFRRSPRHLLTWAWDNWSPGALFGDAERAAMLEAFDTAEFVDTVVHYYQHGAGATDGNPRYEHLQRTLDTWPTITVPTTFLIGDADGCETLPAARASSSSFTGGFELVELPGVGHFVQREAPVRVAEAIRARLSRSRAESVV